MIENEYLKEKIKLNLPKLFDNSLMRKIINNYKNQASILCYHRIIPSSLIPKKSPLNNLIVSKEIFEKQIIHLKENYNIVTLDNIYKSNLKKKIAITFDDGYLDNLIYALPLLKKHNIPATIFITTSFINSKPILWWDLLWKSLKNYRIIDINFNNNNIKYKISSYYERVNVYKKLRKFILSLNNEDKDRFIKKICYINFESDLFLNWDQVINLSKLDLITIGAHTMTHPPLSSLNENQAFKEIYNSKKILEKHINKKVNLFAYPFGSYNECNKREFNLVKRARFSLAVTTNDEVFNLNENSRFSIPRITVVNNNIKSFELQLSGYDNFINSINY